MTAIAVTIAGSDSGGGAGIQADLKAFSALGVYGASVLTALTAQNTLGVTAVEDISPDFITAQMDAVFSDLNVNAVKIGMLSKPEVIHAVAAGLDKHDCRAVVLDPVMVATSGDPLIDNEAVDVLVEMLFPRALLITPNLQEAARLLDRPIANGREEMREQAQALLDLGARAVLLKGGHGDGPECADLLLSREHEAWFSARRHKTTNTHGTGCSLSSAIAAGLARRQDLTMAVRAAKTYISEAIRAADTLSVGSGNGPIHHFHKTWETDDD